MQVEKHSLLLLGLPNTDGNTVVMSVETVNKGLNRRLVQMASIRGCLARLLAHHWRHTLELTRTIQRRSLTDALRIDQAESIDNDLALDGLDGIDDDSYTARMQSLE